MESQPISFQSADSHINGRNIAGVESGEMEAIPAIPSSPFTTPLVPKKLIRIPECGKVNTV